MCLYGNPAAAAQPAATQVQVSRPTTQVTVNRPRTQVTVSRPATSTAVSRPVTAVPVNRPETQVKVSRPTTEVAVNRPVTEAGVFRPVTAGSVVASSSNPGKTVAPAEGSSSSAKTSMSGYKPPVAKDFKAPAAAAQLGGGNSGLGNKTNEAEKDSAAAARQTAAAQNPSALSADKVLANSQALSSGGVNKLQKTLEEQQKSAQKK